MGDRVIWSAAYQVDPVVAGSRLLWPDCREELAKPRSLPNLFCLHALACEEQRIRTSSRAPACGSASGSHACHSFDNACRLGCSPSRLKRCAAGCRAVQLPSPRSSSPHARAAAALTERSKGRTILDVVVRVGVQPCVGVRPHSRVVRDDSIGACMAAGPPLGRASRRLGGRSPSSSLSSTSVAASPCVALTL